LPRRQAVRALTLGLALGVAAWLPFVVADPHTLSAAGRFAIVNDPGSALQALGVHMAGAPHWVRPLQLALGLALGVAAALRGRWAAALLAGVAVRIALDPGTFGYYATGLVAAALMWDLLGARLALPLST